MLNCTLLLPNSNINNQYGLITNKKKHCTFAPFFVNDMAQVATFVSAFGHGQLNNDVVTIWVFRNWWALNKNKFVSGTHMKLLINFFSLRRAGSKICLFYKFLFYICDQFNIMLYPGRTPHSIKKKLFTIDKIYPL